MLLPVILLVLASFLGVSAVSASVVDRSDVRGSEVVTRNLTIVNKKLAPDGSPRMCVFFIILKVICLQCSQDGRRGWSIPWTFNLWQKG